MEPVCAPQGTRRLTGPGLRKRISNPSPNELVQFLRKAMGSLSGKHPLHDAVTEDERVREGRDDVDTDGEEQTPSGCLMPAADQATGG